jgi:hypothetical protein
LFSVASTESNSVIQFIAVSSEYDIECIYIDDEWMDIESSIFV